jgi:hypothetical protein
MHATIAAIHHIAVKTNPRHFPPQQLPQLQFSQVAVSFFTMVYKV